MNVSNLLTRYRAALISGIIALALLLLAACGQEPSTPTPGVGSQPTGTVGSDPTRVPTATPTPGTDPGYKTVKQPAPIHGVSLSESATNPGTWILHVEYGLPSGCAKFADYVIRESFPPQVTVNISLPAPDEPVACTAIYGMATLDIELGGGYEACKTYDFMVNGEKHSVEAISPVAICGPVDPTPSTSDGTAQPPAGYKAVPAPIESVNLNQPEGSSQWILHVEYGLSNGCVRPGNYSVLKSEPAQYVVNSFVPEDPNVICTMVYGTAAFDIPVSGSFEACKVYSFRVNGKDFEAQAITPTVRCAESTGASGSGSGGIIAGSEALLLSLGSFGLDVRRAEEIKEGFFGLPSLNLSVDKSTTAQVTEFQGAAEAEKWSKKVSKDGSSVERADGTIVSVMWVERPHFYLIGNTVVIVFGDNQKVLDAMDKMTGGQFAG